MLILSIVGLYGLAGWLILTRLHKSVTAHSLLIFIGAGYCCGMIAGELYHVEFAAQTYKLDSTAKIIWMFAIVCLSALAGSLIATYGISKDSILNFFRIQDRRLHHIAYCNVILIIAAGVLGEFYDAWYFRHVGWGPNSYTTLFWLAVVFNGPSALMSWLVPEAAFPSSFYMGSQYVLQYSIWAPLCYLQWKIYGIFIGHIEGRLPSKTVVTAITTITALAGIAAAVWSWTTFNCPGPGWCDRFFWPVRIFSLAFVVPAILLLTRVRSSARARDQGTGP